MLTKGIEEGKMFQITVQPFTVFGYGLKMGPVLVRTPYAKLKAPEFSVSINKKSHYIDASLQITPHPTAITYALRYGKSLTKSLPLVGEKITLLPANFTRGAIRIQPFLWHYFGLSIQSPDGRWSKENSKWLQGPLKGYTGFSNAPDSIVLLWSQIDENVNPDTYMVSFKASDEIIPSNVLVKNSKETGSARIKIGSLRADTTYDFEIRNGDAKCDKTKSFQLSVKTKAKDIEP